MNFTNVGLDDLATIFGLVAAGGGLVWGFLRTKLGMDFAPRVEVKAIDSRLGVVESKLGTLPTHDDLRRLGERLSQVERGVDGLAAETRGVRDLMSSEMNSVRLQVGRVELLLSTLLRHELDKEAKGGKAP